MFGELNKERLAIQKEFEERREALEHETTAARSKVEEDALRQKEELNQQREQDEMRLEERMALLEQREQALDDRQHMHARRDLRQQIAKNFKEKVRKPAVSPRASYLRMIVFSATLVVGIAFAYAAFYTFREMPGIYDMPLWIAISWILRSTIFTVLALETIMEVGEKENTEVPDAWVEGVCRDLFSEKGGPGSGGVPSNVVSMLLDSVSGAKLGPDGAELKMGGRGARRLARRLEQ